MLIEFSKVDLEKRPTLLLCSADGTPIQFLGYASDIKLEIHYNETSSLSFDYPAEVDGNHLVAYDDIVGMREVLWDDVGYFILTNPEENNDGIKRVKSCKAYSAEYEFTYKNITLEEGTYDFYDTVDATNTVIGRIMELMPSWSIGSIDPVLVGKYRTFDTVNDNVYNFIKSTVQDTYQCIFDFDTLNRKVNVRSISSLVSTAPVYLAMENLVKDVKIEEQTEDVFTCLDVNGADGVDIRSVNPLGTNKIYDLSYFMTESNVGAEMAEKYKQWSTAYDAARLPYFNATVEMVLEQARLETERAKLVTLQGEKSVLEEQLSVFVEAAAQGVDGVNADIADVKSKITAKDTEISNQETLIEDVQSRIDVFYETLKRINSDVAFSTFFTADEMLVLNKYIKEESIQDSNFVISEVNNYTASDRNENITDGSFSISGSNITVVPTSSGKEIYSVSGGSIQMDVGGKTMNAAIVRGALERQSSDASFVLTAYLNKGTLMISETESSEFPSGCVSFTGTCGTITHDCVSDVETGAWSDGTSASAASLNGYWYLTENATEYQKRAIEWDLFEYGMEQLQRVAWPSFTFSVDSCNFLVPDEFAAFRNQLALGMRIYLNVNGNVLEPILIGCSFSFDDLASLTLEFGDKYNCRDARFDLADLLDQSISAGKSMDFNKYNYNAFVDSGASNNVYAFMNSALNASKNAVLAGAYQNISVDNTGIRLRKSDGHGGFLPEQIWMINNNIAFTDDSWDTVKMAIGKFVDANLGECWGTVGPNIVGTLLAGNNLVIESSKKSGDVAVFRVDAKGAQLHNASFDLTEGNGRITLYPGTGLVGGTSTTSSPLFTFDGNGDISGIRSANGDTLISVSDISKNNLPNANFWLDMSGNAYFKGKVFATDGEFSGTIYATNGEFSGAIKAATLEGTLIGKNGGEIKGVSLGIGGPNYDNFTVDENGNVTIKSGSISWSAVTGTAAIDQKIQNAIDTAKTAASDADDAYYIAKCIANGWEIPAGYGVSGTFIDGQTIQSPTITGNDIYAVKAFGVGESGEYGSFGYATGKKFVSTDGSLSTATTYGVAMAAGSTSRINGMITYDSDGYYVIATDSGVRMQAPGHSVTVTSNGCFIDGSPAGSGTAVFG